LLPRPRHHDHINIIVHPRLQDGLVQLPIHLIGISIRRRIAHLDHRHPPVRSIVHKLLGSLAASRLHCSRHIHLSSSIPKNEFQNKFVIPSEARNLLFPAPSTIASQRPSLRFFSPAITPRKNTSPISPAI